jgi:hypothetical protein
VAVGVPYHNGFSFHENIFINGNGYHHGHFNENIFIHDNGHGHGRVRIRERIRIRD